MLPAINAWGCVRRIATCPIGAISTASFPGRASGSVASILANGVFRVIQAHCSYLIDLHTASDFRDNLPQIRADLEHPEALELARAVRRRCVIDGAGPTGSLRREAMRAGIPAIIYEAGPPSYSAENEISARRDGACMNVLDRWRCSRADRRAEPEQILARCLLGARAARPGRASSSRPWRWATREEDQQLARYRPAHRRGPCGPRTDGEIVGMALPRVVLSGFGLFHVGELEADSAAQPD